jgi:hypothetical protein
MQQCTNVHIFYAGTYTQETRIYNTEMRMSQNRSEINVQSKTSLSIINKLRSVLLNSKKPKAQLVILNKTPIFPNASFISSCRSSNPSKPNLNLLSPSPGTRRTCRVILHVAGVEKNIVHFSTTCLPYD